MTDISMIDERLRLIELRLAAAADLLDGAGMSSRYARRYLNTARRERARPPLQRQQDYFGPNWHGPAVDQICRDALFHAKGSTHVSG